MHVMRAFTLEITPEDLIEMIRSRGFDVPDDATFRSGYPEGDKFDSYLYLTVKSSYEEVGCNTKE